jgi:hypothetical protein
MPAQQTAAWRSHCGACGTTTAVDLALPTEVPTGSACRECSVVKLSVADTGTALTITFSRPIEPLPVKGWQCCHCGGTGLEFYGDPCEHCEGTGQC